MGSVSDGIYWLLCHVGKSPSTVALSAAVQQSRTSASPKVALHNMTGSKAKRHRGCPKINARNSPLQLQAVAAADGSYGIGPKKGVVGMYVGRYVSLRCVWYVMYAWCVDCTYLGRRNSSRFA